MLLEICASRLGGDSLCPPSPWTFGKTWTQFWLSKLRLLHHALVPHGQIPEMLLKHPTMCRTASILATKNDLLQHVNRAEVGKLWCGIRTQTFFHGISLQSLLVAELSFFKFHSIKLSWVRSPDSLNLTLTSSLKSAGFCR